MFFILSVCFIVALLLFWWHKVAKVPEKFPPGPIGLPLVGYLPILFYKNILEGMNKLHDDYGPTVSLNIGPGKRMVTIGDYDTLKDAFKDDALSARPPQMHWFNVYFRYGNGNDSRGILFSHGQEWTEQRRFTLRALRDFGFGKSSMEELIHEEVLQFIGELDKHLNEPISVKNKFNISVINGLWTIIAGKRFELDDPELLDIVQKIDEMTAQSGNTNILQVMPSLRHVAPELTNWNHVKKTMGNVAEFVKGVIKAHRLNFEKNPHLKDEPNDFIDEYLGIVDTSPKDSTFHGSLGLQNLESSILDLLLAGSETTSTALTWATLFMIKFPHIQKKVQEEIDLVVGNSRLPENTDRPYLPYTEAVVQEILRVSCIAPLGLPHFAQRDITLCDGRLVIPAGTTVLPNIYRIVTNPRVFPDPDKFLPERFLSPDGKYVKNDHNIIFSVGKRDCLGKSLALTELFLFFTALMQRYNFAWGDGNDVENLSIDGIVGFTQNPPPFKVIVSKRNKT